MRLAPDYETDGFTWCDEECSEDIQRYSVVASTTGFEPVSLGSSPSISYYRVRLPNQKG